MADVIVKLIGGLGNQMFQYAVGRAVACRLNVELALDLTGFEQYDLRRYELDELAVRARVATREELERAGVAPRTPSLINRALARFGFPRGANVLREASFAYDERIESAVAPIYLDGYWQSSRYFANIADTLREEFTLRAAQDPANAAMAKQIEAAQEGAVSLHIRRGDYVTNAHTAQYHGVCSLDYYRAAVAYVAERVRDPHFFIFSDDHEWVSANLDIGFPTTLVQVNGADRGVCDMALMKACRHHIIANSSFSWWGAWLNPSPEKIVVAPKRWFNQSTNDTRDLLPASWVKL